MSALAKLSPHGISLEEAKSFIENNLSQPKVIYDAAISLQLTTTDLAEITELPEREVIDYFSKSAHDLISLNQQRTDIFLLSDLSTGIVFGYNPVTGVGKQVFSFNTSITDIATHHSGDVYGVSFDSLYRYEFATGLVTRIGDVAYGTNSLAIVGDTIYTASTSNSNVSIQDTMGKPLAEHSLPGGRAAGDISIIGDELFRTTYNGIFKTNINSGATVLEIGEIGSKYHGLSQSKDGLLVGFANDGEVKAYLPQTQEVFQYQNVTLIGLSNISGAAEALTAHVQAWG